MVPDEHCSQKAKYLPFFENIIVIAEIALTLPVNNAWPECGASALKLVNHVSEVS